MPNCPTNITLNLLSDQKLDAVNFPLISGGISSTVNLTSASGMWDIDREFAAFRVSMEIQHDEKYLEVCTFSGKIILTAHLDGVDSRKVLVFNRVK